MLSKELIELILQLAIAIYDHIKNVTYQAIMNNPHVIALIPIT